jgi:superfamily II DNA or RNA helicase
MPPTAVRWPHSPSPLILSEQLAPLPEPLACLLRAGEEAAPAAVAALGARALLDLAEVAEEGPAWPPWLAPHQVPAVARLLGIVSRYGGALLADAVGLGKSYVALAVALALGEPFTLVVPAVLVDQWRGLLGEHGVDAPIITHEALSAGTVRLSDRPTVRLFIVDEAHRFRNPDTNRYRALGRLAVGARVLLVTATPVHNRIADLFHLFRLFLRDHDLTALGVPSLRRAARGELDGRAVALVAARLIVARSRRRVRAGYTARPLVLSFPERAAGEVIRAGPTGDTDLERLVAGVGELAAGGDAAGLFRLLLLSQLASSLAAFRASLRRYEAFLDLARDAGLEGRALSRADFQRLFPPAETDDLQLTLFPLLLPPGAAPVTERDRGVARRLRDLSVLTEDPKADALERLLGRAGKTIVFVRPRATVRYLLRRLRVRRIAAVMGDIGWFAAGRATRAEVLRAFAPHAQGAAAPAAALETDILIATDLLSEGLNLQDATRVIHYDLPWSPARLAQRVGRIDRMGSPHARIETVTFLPPRVLEDALALEQRLDAKTHTQMVAGAAQIESISGLDAAPGGLDWCDRLQRLAREVDAPRHAIAAVAGNEDATVLIVRIGALVEALVVSEAEARADPDWATRLLEQGAAAERRPIDYARLAAAVRRGAPLVRARLAAVEAARWRAEDRHRLSRRLIPWVLTAARRAARRGDARELSRLDALVSRLALGMTAGEELLLDELLERRRSLSVDAVLTWHEGLPPARDTADAPRAELVAALLVTRA